MRTIAKLFGRSPFGPLQLHMQQVAACVEMLKPMFEALGRGDHAAVERMAEEISQLEHRADMVKNDIRDDLPRGLFLPIDRGNLLEILGVQDSLADKSENLGVLLTHKRLDMPDFLRETFTAFLDKNVETFVAVQQILQELDELLETSFGGAEAEKVKTMVDNVAFKEHEADVIQRDLVKTLYANEGQISYGAFHLWMKVFEELSNISNLSEKLAYRVRMTLERK